MKSLIVSMVAVSCLFSMSAMANDLACQRQTKKQDGCFLEKSDKMTATVTSKIVVLKSPEMDNLKGTFEKKVKSTGDDQYAATDLSDFLDQSDYGKVFVSEDESKIVLSLRFTDDDGEQNFWSCTYSCEKK